MTAISRTVSMALIQWPSVDVPIETIRSEGDFKGRTETIVEKLVESQNRQYLC